VAQKRFKPLFPNFQQDSFYHQLIMTISSGFHWAGLYDISAGSTRLNNLNSSNLHILNLELHINCWAKLPRFIENSYFWSHRHSCLPCWYTFVHVPSLVVKSNSFLLPISLPSNPKHF
jgi:hypothetical protein